jgi:effector-binding domain-containing protein
VGGAAPGFGSANLGPVLGPAFEQLLAQLKARNVRSEGPFFCFYEGSAETGTLVAYAAAPIGTQSLKNEPPVEVRELPPVEVATLVLDGPAEDVSPSYGPLHRWAEEHGYQATGPGRDVIIDLNPEGSSNPVIEIQLPITRL